MSPAQCNMVYNKQNNSVSDINERRVDGWSAINFIIDSIEEPMFSSSIKPRNIEYLPQLTQSSLNRSFLRQRYDGSTPKGNRINNYPFARYPDKQTCQSPLINSKGMQYLSKFKKNSHKGTYQYESINYPSGKNSHLRTRNSERVQGDQYQDKPIQTFQFYDSIESNLTECDKILLKLKNISLSHRDYPYVKKNSLHEYYQTKKTQESKDRSERDPETEYSSKYNQFSVSATEPNLDYLTTSSENTTPYPKVNSAYEFGKQSGTQRKERSKEKEKEYQTVGSQKLESVIQIRRQRIQEIIHNRRNSIDNPIQGSFVRMRARGEKLFNKMVRTRQKSMDNVYLQDEQY